MPLMPDFDRLITDDNEDGTYLAFFLALDDLIIAELDPTQNFLSEEGVALQRMYDDIFYTNFER